MANEETYNYLTDRVGKITSALYKVTDFMSDKEPLKWSLRGASVNILINVVSLKDKDSQGKITSFAEIFESLNKVIHMLDIASISSFIAGLNFEILKREYEKIGELIETDKKEEILFSDKLFPELTDSVHKDKYFNKGQTDIHNGQYKGQALDKGQGLYKGHSYKGQGQNMSVMNSYYGVGGIQDKQRLGSKNSGLNQNKNISNNNENIINKNQFIDSQKDAQLRDIIDFIKKNGHVTIKDISSNFPKMSQKTIQRRLLYVVDNGLLEKEGDKRWRRYFVKK
ncbi:MAG: ArsR family transcriptional regulator [Parcubacteria group bacterium]|nr:ArsR family transcriptional regulator [Parcubacteria group bacterium]MCR4342494.1 ArsR family transcriptional regulator [Patescibacteria group bacterium]